MINFLNDRFSVVVDNGGTSFVYPVNNRRIHDQRTRKIISALN
jgi:hypothetical protein